MGPQNKQQGGGSTAQNAQRAVSPVVGVAILVGITVILASVVGAFVFGLVNIGESSPNASFTFSESSSNFSTNASVPGDALDGVDRNLKLLRVTHNSGEAIGKSNLVAKVSGNKSEPQSNGSVYEIQYEGDTSFDRWSLVLNDSAGDQEILKPGDSFKIGMYGYSRSAISGNVIHDYNVTDSNPPTAGIGIDSTGITVNNPPNPPHAKKLGECDTVEVVWRSDSGAQGQVLQSYQLSGTACT